MSNVIVDFPKRFRHQLPSDAIPRGRERFGEVFPLDGAWVFVATDDGGGHIMAGLTKAQAMNEGLRLVLDYAGTLTVLNHNPDEVLT